jgi:hypothetical protein
VAGIIALWLQANPNLTRDDIIGVLQRTSRHPEEGLSYPNNKYGYGEIDAYRGLLDILGADRIEGLSLHQSSKLHVYPIEGGLKLVTDTSLSETIWIKVYNLSGACIHKTSITINGTEAFLPLPIHVAGVYAVQVETINPALKGSQLVRL